MQLYPLHQIDAYDEMARTHKAVEGQKEYNANRALGALLEESGGQLSEEAMQGYISKWGSAATKPLEGMMGVLKQAAGHSGDMLKARNSLGREQRSDALGIAQHPANMAAAELSLNNTLRSEEIAGLEHPGKVYTAGMSLESARRADALGIAEHDANIGTQHNLAFDNATKLLGKQGMYDAFAQGDAAVRQFIQSNPHHADAINKAWQQYTAADKNLASYGEPVGDTGYTKGQVEYGDPVERIVGGQRQYVTPITVRGTGELIGFADASGGVHKTAQSYQKPKGGAGTGLELPNGTPITSSTGELGFAQSGGAAVHNLIGDNGMKRVEDAIFTPDVIKSDRILQGVVASWRQAHAGSKGYTNNFATLVGPLRDITKAIQGNSGGLQSALPVSVAKDLQETAGNVAVRTAQSLVQWATGQYSQPEKIQKVFNLLAGAARDKHEALRKQAKVKLGNMLRGYNPNVSEEMVEQMLNEYIGKTDEVFADLNDFGLSGGNERLQSVVSEINRMGGYAEDPAVLAGQQVKYLLSKFANIAPTKHNIGDTRYWRWKMDGNDKGASLIMERGKPGVHLVSDNELRGW